MHNLWELVSKPDNIPIVGLLFLVIGYTWWSFYRAFKNDKQGYIDEARLNEKIQVWPNLVRVEFLAALLVMVILLFWSFLIDAPLEEAANPSLTPNPSKAPWYFLGLQEMLVYFDPWIAGVIMPTLIIVGLMAIPYIDVNEKGNGYYTYKERKFAIVTYCVGFLILWVALIVLGTFLRGPNWNFFGPFEFWDLHKLEALVNVNLSEYIWVRGLRTGLPSNWLVRESPGILLVLLYLFALPPLLAKSVFKGYFGKLGASRFYVTVFLFLTMMSLPAKMLLRWLFNLKYIVAIPEFFFNI